jgi:hypothetical protein
MIVDRLTDFQLDLEEALATSGSDCQPDRITITAGEPAAPAGPCTAVWIWADRIEDELELADGCAVRTRLTIAYRIDACYEETVEDASDAIHLEAADCLYSMMSRIWCGLVRFKDLGALAGSTGCDRIVLEPLATDQRAGGIVSATGSVTVDYHC